MDSFYIIPNQLKDRNFAITSEIKSYIENNGRRCYVAEKDPEGHIIPGTVPDDVECGLVLGGDGTLIRFLFWESIWERSVILRKLIWMITGKRLTICSAGLRTLKSV